MKFLFWIIFLFYIVPTILKIIRKHMSSNMMQNSGLNMNMGGVFNFMQKIFSPTITRESRSEFSGSTNNSINSMKKLKKMSWIIITIIITIIIVANIFVVIPVGNTGVQVLFGKVKNKELSSGLHIVNPLVEIERMSIRTEEYTMSAAQGEGQRVGADQIQALTKEGLAIDLDITVFYHLMEDKASDVHKDLGNNFHEKIIRPEIRSAIREVVARYDTKAVYSEKRSEVAMEIKDRLVETITPRGIVVEQILLRNVTLPPKLSASIQEKLQAEQESQRYDFLLEKEKKEAERKRIEASGQRDSQEIINQSLTSKYLEYFYIKELKDRKGTIYVPTGSNGLPLFKSVQ